MKKFFKKCVSCLALAVASVLAFSTISHFGARAEEVDGANAENGANAANDSTELYANGDFEGFFKQDFELTQRNYNTFTSLASSSIAPADSEAYVSADPLNEGNRALKMTKGKTNGGFGTFFTTFSKSLQKISNDGGMFEFSFDFYPQGWDDSSVIPLDKKLWFVLSQKSGTYFVAKDKSAIVEPNANAVVNLSDFPDSPTLEGYKRVTFSIELAAGEAATDAITFWFYNANGKTCAWLDNFSVKYEGVEVIADGSFESFDLTSWACPDVSVTAPMQNWGVSTRSAISTYSPAALYTDGQNRVVRFQKGQGTSHSANKGELVEFTLGGERIFPNEGGYVIEADVRIEAAEETLTAQNFSVELSDFFNPSAGLIQTYTLFSGNAFAYTSLPDSSLSGYKHVVFPFLLTEDEAETISCMSFVFDTAEGRETMYLDNLSIRPIDGYEATMYETSRTDVDRSEQENVWIHTNLGDLDAEVDMLVNGKETEVDAALFIRKAGLFSIDYRLFEKTEYVGVHTIVFKTAYGTVEVPINVTGVSGAPEMEKTSYAYSGKGDVTVKINLKGGSIQKVTGDGIKLQSNEYALSQDQAALTIKESFLLTLLAGENVFTVQTEGGDCNFIIVVPEPQKEPEKPSNPSNPSDGNGSEKGSSGCGGTVSVVGVSTLLAFGFFSVIFDRKED